MDFEVKNEWRKELPCSNDYNFLEIRPQKYPEQIRRTTLIVARKKIKK
jgi:hypothetical protein